MIDIETDDDEIYFTPTSSTNLASLFNSTMYSTNQAKDTSLTYKPPKQPPVKGDDSATSQQPKPKYQSSVILFKEVHAFQLINKEYSSFGKCGLAVVGNEQVHIYQLLLYKQKNNIISTSKITATLKIIIQKNNYISITDDRKLTWAVHFHNEKDLNECTEVLARKCECKLTRHDVEPVKEETPESKEYEKTYEVKKNASDGEGDEKANKKEIKTKKKSVSDKSDVKNTKLNNIHKVFCIKSENLTDENMSKNIDSDTSDSSGATKKADILSRVAKMGKKLIPKETEATDSSDVEEKHNSDELKFKRSKTGSKTSITEKELINIMPENPGLKANASSQYIQCNLPEFLPVSKQYLHLKSSMNQIMVPLHDNQSQVLYSTPQLPSDQLNMFFVENRTHCSEMRMSIMRLQTGMDEMLNSFKKTESSKHSNDSQTETQSENESLKENNRLKSLVEEKENELSTIKSHLEIYKKKNDDLMRKEAEHSYEIASLTEETARCAYEEHKLHLKIKEQQAQLNTQSIRLSEYQEKLDLLNAAYTDCIHVKKNRLPEAKENIKQQMNVFYNEVCSIFKSDTAYDGNRIKELIAPAIIDNTYKVLNIINKLFSEG